MDLILDTCGVLSLSGLVDRTLSKAVLKRIREADSVGVSACSAFEIAVKFKKGGLNLGRFATPEHFWSEALRAYELEEIPITCWMPPGIFFAQSEVSV